MNTETYDKSLNLDILPVKNDDTKKKIIPLHPNLPNFNKPLVILFIAPRGSGKTNVIVNLLARKDFRINECIDNCFIITPSLESDKTLKPLRELHEGNCYSTYRDSIIDDIEKYQMSYNEDERPHSVILYDDAVQKCGFKYNSFDLLSCRSRHRNITLITAVQSIKSCKKIYRLNATDIFIYKTRSFKEFMDIYEAFGAVKYTKKEFENLFNYATNQQYHFLYIKWEGIKDAPRFYKNFNEDITDRFLTNKNKKNVGSIIGDE